MTTRPNLTALLAASAVLSLAATTSASSQTRADRREFTTDFSKHTVPFEEIVSGGPPKDGIPSIDRPRFTNVREADRWLSDRDPVVLVALHGIARAYPLQILMHHEIVNDVVGETPVTVTFCPLCNTAISFDRRFDGQVLDFGTTGRLRHSDLIMYDRQTETWWQQAIGEGIVGEYAGERLKFIHSPLISWKTFKQAHPDGEVLSRDTGHRRNYGVNLYGGYDRGRGPWPTFFSRRPDGRLPAMERVAAVELNGHSVAFAFSALAEKRVITEDIGGVPVVAFWAPGTASALDAQLIADGRDVGSSGVFDRRLDGRVLRFEPAGDGRFTDRETGSTWDILGRAVEGPLRGRQLTPIVHGNHFWFAWGAFKPETRLLK
ncbi:MAG: DUF3179 domain-containing protein [Gemmatimonadetes bacterium]|nr:DUF3179 domain-containing protein [Gemmatimonadota bacterium]